MNASPDGLRVGRPVRSRRRPFRAGNRSPGRSLYHHGAVGAAMATNKRANESNQRQGSSGNLGGEQRREGGRSSSQQQDRNESGRFEGKTGQSGQRTGGNVGKTGRRMGEEEE